jgi:hypothetical protein
MVADLRRRFPRVCLRSARCTTTRCLEFIRLYHSFGQTLVADLVQRHAKFFQHLSHAGAGRGSTGVHGRIRPLEPARRCR